MAASLILIYNLRGITYALSFFLLRQADPCSCCIQNSTSERTTEGLMDLDCNKSVCNLISLVVQII